MSLANVPGFEIRREWSRWPMRTMLEDLVRTLPLEQRTIKVFGREHDVPRLTAWMGEASYAYSGIAHPPAAMPEWLVELRRSIERDVRGARFNSVLANYYRGGSDSVAWHADDEPELGDHPTIASISLGASRRFAIKHRHSGVRHDVILEHGDLLIMSGRSQLDWLHSVPRTARPTGPRLNLTFRHVTDL